MERTSRIIRPILEFIFPGAPEQTLVFYHGLIRKSAHFTEYGILGLLAFRAFTGSALRVLSSRPYLPAIVLCLVIAVFDETLQSFDPSRTATVRDVLLDLSGAALVLVLIACWKRVPKN